ncbi:MAG: TraB/GumN family protein [Pseudomonadota bacterium]
MKKAITHLLPLLALALSSQGNAQTSHFNGGTGLVDIPCITLYKNGVAVPGNGGNPYRVRAQLKAINAQQFSVAGLLPAITGDECVARFDQVAGLYTDVVNVGDNAYEITMKIDTNNVFSLTSHKVVGPAKTSMWVVSNGENTVYIGGTIHILRPADHPVPRAYDEAYAKASSVYFELDMDNPAELGVGLTQGQVQIMVRDPEVQSLKNVLSSEAHGALSIHLGKKGIQMLQVDTWSAQMVVNVFVTPDLRIAAGATATGVDATFANKAIADKKPVFGLESFQSQITLLHALNEGRESELVLESLAALEDGSAPVEIGKLINAWRLGDVAYIQSESEENRAESARDYDLVLTNRNNAWLPQIEALLRSPETELVLVGAAHMAGPEGLVALLKSLGYNVRKY